MSGFLLRGAHPLRRNLMLGAAACLVANLALAAWLLSPAAPSRSATELQLRLAQTQRAELRAEASQLSRLRERLHTSQEQMQELMAAGIPEEADASSKLLQEFGRIANLSQVQVSGAEFHPDKKAQLGLRRVAINLQVSGGYAGVVRFVNQMERSPMFFLINQVSVSGGSGGSAASQAGPSEIKLQVQLEAYERATGGTATP